MIWIQSRSSSKTFWNFLELQTWKRFKRCLSESLKKKRLSKREPQIEKILLRRSFSLKRLRRTSLFKWIFISLFIWSNNNGCSRWQMRSTVMDRVIVCLRGGRRCCDESRAVNSFANCMNRVALLVVLSHCSIATSLCFDQSLSHSELFLIVSSHFHLNGAEYHPVNTVQRIPSSGFYEHPQQTPPQSPGTWRYRADSQPQSNAKFTM